jgi:hypothetical protein
MPDLKSQLAEVKHKLATMAFDDSGEATEAPTPTEGQSQSRNIWLSIKDHPGSTAAEVAERIGVDRSSASTLTSQMFLKGILKRTKADADSTYRYSVADPNYKPMTKQEAIERAIAAKSAGTKKAKAKTKAKVEAASTPLPPNVKFSATIPQLLDTLSVVQARALYDALKKIFGA